MYKLLLILKYLRRKIAPMFAAMAVTLCTAMVIIVISVMGGFLDQMRETAKKLTADVTIGSDLGGFPYYDELVEEIRTVPQVKTATPIVKAYGLAKFLGGVYKIEVQGVRPDQIDAVIGFFDTLYWTKQHLTDEIERMSPDLRSRFGPFLERLAPRLDGRTLEAIDDWSDLPGIVMGIEVSPTNRRDSQGRYNVFTSTLAQQVTLTVLPLTGQGGVLDPAVRTFVVVNEFKSGFYETDALRVYVPFEELQRMLQMDEAEQADPLTGEPTGQMIPARASEVLVRGQEDVDLAELRKAVDRKVLSVIKRHPDERLRIGSLTWEEVHGTLLKAVQNEKGLITFLFAIISVVAIVMVATTFSLIVFAKTRDIGVLRALGASRWGIANIFLGYGLAIGIVGSLAGMGLAYAIVTHLNEIQDLLDQWFGWRMWDPSIYFFDRIPDRVDPTEAAAIVVGSMVSSILGALIPAFLASRLNPVEALRYE